MSSVDVVLGILITIFVFYCACSVYGWDFWRGAYNNMKRNKTD